MHNAYRTYQLYENTERKSAKYSSLSGEVLAWLSVWSEVQMVCIWSSWCHCHPIISCSSKIQNGLLFWCRLTRVVLEKRPLNGCSSGSSTAVCHPAMLSPVGSRGSMVAGLLGRLKTGRMLRPQGFTVNVWFRATIKRTWFSLATYALWWNEWTAANYTVVKNPVWRWPCRFVGSLATAIDHRC